MKKRIYRTSEPSGMFIANADSSIIEMEWHDDSPSSV